MEVDNGEVVVGEDAANALVWQDADVLDRVEGFANLPDVPRLVDDGT